MKLSSSQKKKLAAYQAEFEAGLKSKQPKTPKPPEKKLTRVQIGNSAKDQAKQMGLEYYGFGYWGRNDKVLYHTVNNRLESVNAKHFVVTTQKKYSHKNADLWLKSSTVPSTVNFDKLHTYEKNLRKKFTESEKDAIFEYVGSSTGINKSIMLGAKDPDYYELYKDTIKNLDSAIKKSSIPEDVVVYRGLSTSKAVKALENLIEKDDYIKIPTFSSTSLSPYIAYEQFNDAKKENRNLLVIKIAAGSNVLPVLHGEMPEEREIILPRDSVLKLVKVEERKSSGRRFIFELQ